MGNAKEQNLWGGRFTGEADPAFAEFNRSFGFDRRLIAVDVRASIAHCQALVSARVLTAAEGQQIQVGLETVLERSKDIPGYCDDLAAEDVHSFVEARLIALVGDLGRKLHTGRSRNDQVATDFRIWLREQIDTTLLAVNHLRSGLLDLAEANREAVLPGYTHLQRAQPIMFAHWCLAYFEMLTRDRERLRETRGRVNVLPVGSAALAGTSYPIDRQTVARTLEFDSVARNSLDAVSDRDFCIEFAAATALIMMHLSRLAEDIILYASTEFGFFELSDAVATGSSLMPQKKNPDSMELVRGKAGRVFGHLMALLTTMKGLPMAYNKDMQEDKEAIFDAADTVLAGLQVSETVLRNLQVNASRTHEAATRGYLNATELADYLVRKGIPFRQAHEMVGRMVMRAIERDCELNDLSLDEFKSFSPLVTEDVFAALSITETLKTKSQIGGTAPERVAEALAAARKQLAAEQGD